MRRRWTLSRPGLLRYQVLAPGRQEAGSEREVSRIARLREVDPPHQLRRSLS